MIEERRWPLGNKVTELYSGVERGSISSIKWKDTLIAWCNSESQVQMNMYCMYSRRQCFYFVTVVLNTCVSTLLIVCVLRSKYSCISIYLSA